ncbi:S-adenosyl-L-methionine-dependent methyltransferase, partial [Cadophora sp. DSE1049]
QPSQSIKPMSKQGDFIPPISPSTEGIAVKHLLQNHTRIHMDKQSCKSAASCLSLDGDGFTEFELSEFSIYLPHNKFQPFSMRGLQHLGTKSNNIRYLFDGILSLGATRHYVQDIPFSVRSIGNYGEDLHEVGSHIWIQSEMNTDINLFYRLGKPSAKYARFHHEFIWLADFAKHFVDYLQVSEHPISLHRFRKDFYQWLNKTHSRSSAFRGWYRRYNKEDFRSAVSVNTAFLFSESMGINPELKSHPIWSEVMSQDIVPPQEIEEQETIVTEYVYECFKNIRFGHHLKVLSSASFPSTSGYPAMKSTDSPNMKSQQTILDSFQLEEVPIRSRSMATATVANQSVSPTVERSTLIQDVKVGDVLSVTKDGSQSVWKDEISRWKVADDCWYVYVQKVHSMRDGEPTYDVIWLYRPSDTSCAKMKYPYPKELFMSDNCTCLRARIAADEVLAIVPVRWYGQPSEPDQSHFIRQTYLQNERFVTLEEQHKTCEHFRGQANMAPSKLESMYPIGSTVLVPPRYKSKHGLEPYEIDNYITEGVKQIAVLRRLLRRQEVDKSGEKNELVYTDEFEKVPAHKIQRTCHVRFYSESDVINQMIPTPYNRKGNGNAFYIITRLVEKNAKKLLKPIGVTIPKSLIQGINPLDSPDRGVLSGLDLFCGGGNFGRGLEEGGAVRNRWAADIDKNAIHTYNANVDESDPTKLFYGSVNDMLAQAMKGNPKNSDLIPLPGEVDFISAGSPCQGFSNLNNEPNNEKGLRNQSLIASVAAYIDFYRPKYGILENVLSMAKKGRGRDEDVMSQLICAIVGMGYQVQLSVLDAWSFGSPQSRGRLFLTFAASGLKPMEHPELSHSHPPNALSRGLGKLANGQAFGVRRSGSTPFEWVTLEESMSDLPVLGDGATYQCIPFPDHVMAGTLTEQLRGRIEAIPTHPRGMNFYKAWNDGQGPMTPEERERFPPMYKKNGTMRALYKPQSRAYTRVDPKGIFPCMTVAVSPGDIIMGSGIHWDDQRMFTAMEGRRIQGAPEHEVFLGSPSEVWKILGNSVNRNVSLALGLSLRDAWFANDPAIYRP